MNEEEKEAIEEFDKLIYKHNYNEIILEDSEGWTSWNTLFEKIKNIISKLQKELDKKDKVIKQLQEDISNMYDEKVVRNILEDECGLSKFEIDEILN